MLASSATGGASPVSPSWVISALRAALRRLRSETRLRAQARTPPSPARGMQHPQRDRAADGCPTLYNQFLKGQQLLSCAKRAAATRISLFAYLWQLLFVQSLFRRSAVHRPQAISLPHQIRQESAQIGEERIDEHCENHHNEERQHPFDDSAHWQARDADRREDVHCNRRRR